MYQLRLNHKCWESNLAKDCKKNWHVAIRHRTLDLKLNKLESGGLRADPVWHFDAPKKNSHNLKCYVEVIAIPLTLMFNKLLKEGIVPKASSVKYWIS